MSRKPDFEMRLRVLNAVYDAPGETIRARIKGAAEKSFVDARTGTVHRFTWRTISTWLYRHKKRGVTTLENKTRSDKDGSTSTAAVLKIALLWHISVAWYLRL